MSDLGLFVAMQDAAPTATAAQEGADTFRPVDGEPEEVSGTILVVEAYALMWVVAFVMIFFSLRRQRQLTERLGQLERDLARVRAGADENAGSDKGD